MTTERIMVDVKKLPDYRLGMLVERQRAIRWCETHDSPIMHKNTRTPWCWKKNMLYERHGTVESCVLESPPMHWKVFDV